MERISTTSLKKTALVYNSVPASSRVVVLKRLLKGYAESSFYDWES